MKCELCTLWTKSWRMPFCRKHWASFRTDAEKERALQWAWSDRLTRTPWPM